MQHIFLGGQVVHRFYERPLVKNAHSVIDLGSVLYDMFWIRITGDVVWTYIYNMVNYRLTVIAWGNATQKRAGELTLIIEPQNLPSQILTRRVSLKVEMG